MTLPALSVTVVALALLTALSELSILGLRKAIFGDTMHLSPSVVWMAPLATLVIFAAIALPLVALSRVWPRLASAAVVVAVFTCLGLLSFLLVERRLSLWALALLSLGIGVQAGRVAARHYPGFLRLTRITAVALLVLFTVGGAAVEASLVLRERRAEAAMPAPPAGAPNVLFIILDTVRAMSLDLYGYPRETMPNLTRFAQRGVAFEMGIVPGTWTVPSHASMFSGHWPNELTSWWSSAEKQPPFPTLAETLRAQGYRTGGFIGNWFHIGWESGMNDGFIHYSDIDHSPAHVLRASASVRWLTTRRWFKRVVGLYETFGRRYAPSVNASALRWIGDDHERPYFAFINYFDAHSPYLPKAPFDTLFGESGAAREPIVIEELNRVVQPGPEVVQAEIDAYDGGLAALDAHLGRLLDELERRGALENTLVIIGSDHGEELGDHGRWGHAYSLHSEIVHVPLVVVGPGVPAGVRVSEPASLRNIPATIADLAGLAPATFPGVSLAMHWRARAAGTLAEDTVLTIFNRYRSIHHDGYHYFVGVMDDKNYLYDYRTDPLERHNLAGTPEGERVMATLRELAERIAPRGGPAVDPTIPPPGN